MKRTITGWMPLDALVNKTSHYQALLTTDKLASNDTEVTITFDDGKPSTKTVWEWMFLSGTTKEWAIYSCLLTEEEAAKEFGDEPHKKLREFSVEVEGE